MLHICYTASLLFFVPRMDNSLSKSNVGDASDSDMEFSDNSEEGEYYCSEENETGMIILMLKRRKYNTEKIKSRQDPDPPFSTETWGHA